MQASANKADEELKTLVRIVHECYDNDLDKTEWALYDLHQRKKEEIELIEQEYEPLIKRNKRKLRRKPFKLTNSRNWRLSRWKMEKRQRNKIICEKGSLLPLPKLSQYQLGVLMLYFVYKVKVFKSNQIK